MNESDDIIEGGSQVIARAASILRTLEDSPQGLTIAVIARASDLPRTTVTRLVRALEAEQIVDTCTGKVRLGAGLIRLARAVHFDAAALARPHMEALSRTLHETVDLWIEREDHVELVAEVPSDQEVRIVAVPGSRLPLHVSAPGKAFLAELDEMRLIRCTEGRLDRCTTNSLTSVDALLAELKTTRKTGISVDLEEHAEDVCAISMLVQIGLTDRYAIAVPVPARRFGKTRKQIEQALRACVEEIEARR
ncbi:IclR family transcriptional regulator [Acetobacter sp. P1H12_c]|uniref:IclR family transcriptional regulator n=1 Tax=Acetobacter sp. P1H12_c TaxID=2762621 RepID=UPI001C049250|nr:IclR family transcriptional regulator [Acetobacter sp. P1H12_c]